MTRRAKIWITVGAVVLVLGGATLAFGPSLYADYANAQAEAPPQLSAGSEREAVSFSDLAGSWTVGSGSFAGYRVHEVLRGADVTVTGRTEEVNGSLTVDGGRLTAARFTVDVASIRTSEPARDTYFRNVAMDVSQFPDATFTLTDPVPEPAGTASGDGGPWDVPLTGDLTIHGVTRPVTTTAQVVLAQDEVQVAGSIPITFADFAVAAPDLGFVRVDDAGSVEFSLELERG